MILLCLLFCSFSDASIAAYRVELARVTQDIHRLRQRVQAMTTACPWPLSRDWEIRIDDAVFDETGKVYFVNHRDRSTTYEVPPPPEPDETQFLATSMVRLIQHSGHLMPFSH